MNRRTVRKDTMRVNTILAGIVMILLLALPGSGIGLHTRKLRERKRE